MNAPIWIAWLVVALLLVLSVILLKGKGSFLIAGYNTSDKEEKAKYNEKRLCRVIGGGLCIITFIMGIFTFFKFDLPSGISWLMPWGLMITLAVMIVLANTVCREKSVN